jgi:hypothetical protein
MKFSAKLWKQGSSLLITVPFQTVKDSHLKEGQTLSFDVSTEYAVCQCGKMCPIQEKPTHECFYIIFQDLHNAVKASELIISKSYNRQEAKRLAGEERK